MEAIVGTERVISAAIGVSGIIETAREGLRINGKALNRKCTLIYDRHLVH